MLKLDEKEAQHFLTVIGAKGISGYGNAFDGFSRLNLDKAFFNLFKEDDTIKKEN